MERYTIENDVLKVGINQKGAELASIVNKANGKEYMWQADPSFWGRHSCVLFPIVGKLAGGEYSVNGEKFELGQHGFVRNRLFTVAAKSEERIDCRYESTQGDKSLYPFSVAINMIYELIGDTLSITYVVENHSGKAISFGIGGHPAFNCPLNKEEKRSDYILRFEQKETAPSFVLNSNGVFDGRTKIVFDGSTDLKIKDNLFDDDALVFKDLKSTKVSLVNKADKPVLSFDFKNFPYLGIWSKNQHSPYICIEPWCGIADNEGGQEDFFQKEGNQTLAAGELFTCTHKVTIH